MTEKQRKLVNDYHDLIYKFLYDYGYDIDDFYDLAAIGLCKAAISWDESKGSFVNHAYARMRSELSHYFTIQNYKKRVPSCMIVYYNTKAHDDSHDEIGEFIEALDVGKRFEDDLIFDICVENIRKRMSDRDKLIFDMLIEGYTTREIGKVAGCSNVNVTNIRRKMCDTLRDLIGG